MLNKKRLPEPTDNLFIINIEIFYIRKLSRIPAATAEPITPATFGPIACISKWFVLSYSKPTT
jgi:hypothetical protein